MKRVLVAALFFTACVADVESQVTINQGLYGQIRESCSKEGCVGAPRINAPVAWFLSDPFEHDAGTPQVLVMIRTNSSGFWELALDAGAQGFLTLGSDVEDPPFYFSTTEERVPRGTGRIDWQSGGLEEGTWTHVK